MNKSDKKNTNGPIYDKAHNLQRFLSLGTYKPMLLTTKLNLWHTLGSTLKLLVTTGYVIIVCHGNFISLASPQSAQN